MFQPRHAHATVQKKVKVAEVCVTKVAKPLTREFGSGEKNNVRTVQELKHTCNTFSAHISAQQAKTNCISSNFHIFLSSCPEILHPHKHIPTGSSTSQPLLQAPPPHPLPSPRIIVCVPALLCFYAVCSSETKSRAALEGRGGGERRPTTASSKVLQTHKQATVRATQPHAHQLC